MSILETITPNVSFNLLLISYSTEIKGLPIEHFNLFLEELETYRLFIKDYFFSIEDELCFHINSDYPTLRLADDIIYNYLNYNTNL